MGYFIHLGLFVLDKKRAHYVGIFYILRKYVWYEGMYKAYQTVGSYNKIYRILSTVWEILGVRTWYIEFFMTFKNMFEFWEQENLTFESRFRFWEFHAKKWKKWNIKTESKSSILLPSC